MLCWLQAEKGSVHPYSTQCELLLGDGYECMMVLTCCWCPPLVLQDEVDSLGQSRGANTDAGARRLLTELLIQFTRAAGEEGVYVFGATNRMQASASLSKMAWLLQQARSM